MPSVNDFLDYFSEIYSHDSDTDTYFDLSDTGLNNENESLSRNFTASEIERGILKLKNSKSPGFDGIKNEYIKLSKENMLPVYVSGAISEQWTIGKINKNKKWVPLRAMKTFVRKKMGHTT